MLAGHHDATGNEVTLDLQVSDLMQLLQIASQCCRHGTAILFPSAKEPDTVHLVLYIGRHSFSQVSILLPTGAPACGSASP